MQIKLTLLTLLVCGLAIPAAIASPVNGTDKTNGARACTTLRTSLGPSTFAQTYKTNGACVSAWVAKAHSARVAATSTCKHRGLKGRALASCITARTNSSLSASTSTTKNAAKACAAEETSLGAGPFNAKYGTNANDQNAFGKCVSMKATGKTPPTTAAQHYATSLTALNNSGVSGSGTLLLNSDKLIVKLTLSGLETGQDHQVAIRGLSTGNGSCPTSAADTNHDGTISLSEAQPSVGDVLITLTANQQNGEQLSVSSSWLPLTTRTIVVLGKTVNGSYDATLPVACGTITATT